MTLERSVNSARSASGTCASDGASASVKIDDAGLGLRFPRHHARQRLEPHGVRRSSRAAPAADAHPRVGRAQHVDVARHAPARAPRSARPAGCRWPRAARARRAPRRSRRTMRSGRRGKETTRPSGQEHAARVDPLRQIGHAGEGGALQPGRTSGGSSRANGRRALERVGDLEDRDLAHRAADQLQADRQARRGEAARHADRRQPREVHADGEDVGRGTSAADRRCARRA